MAARGALMYFLIDSLPSLDRTYYFSMATFVAILQKGGNPHQSVCSLVIHLDSQSLFSTGTTLHLAKPG